MARRTTTSTRSPPFALCHITRQTYALPSTVRKSGSAQSVHLTSRSTKRNSVERLRPSIRSTCPSSSIVDVNDPRANRKDLGVLDGSVVKEKNGKKDSSTSGTAKLTIEHRLEPGNHSTTVLCTVPAGFPSSK